MIYSKSKQFAFFRLPRTGSTSMTEMLLPYASISGVHQTKITPEFPFYKHMKLSQFKDAIGQEAFDNTFKFCFVRNPYSRSQSLYHHRRKHYKEGKSSLKKLIYGFIFQLPIKISFLAFTIFLLNPNKGLTMSVTRFITDEKGNKLVDKVYKFEEIDQSYQDLADQLHLEDVHKIVKVNPSIKREGEADISSWLARKIIRYKYNETFKAFYK
ncbi:MAG: sulfotransferase family 2 domain-containing protein [Cyclobacteriaceae bacterium]